MYHLEHKRFNQHTVERNPGFARSIPHSFTVNRQSSLAETGRR